MNSNHLFNVKLHWVTQKETQPTETKIYHKNHHIEIDGKADLAVSAAKAFKGDSTLYNPEDLLLSSLTSCHMMSYLYCCQQNNITVISYTDNAEAQLEVNQDGSGKICKVILRPEVVIRNSNQIEFAISLHQ